MLTFTKTDRVLGYKTNLNKLKKIEIIQRSFLDHNEIKLEINNKRKFEILQTVKI